VEGGLRGRNAPAQTPLIPAFPAPRGAGLGVGVPEGASRPMVLLGVLTCYVLRAASPGTRVAGDI